MKLNILDRAGFLRLFQKLQGSGYSQDEDANVTKEREAWSDIAAKVSEPLAAVYRNLFLSAAVEALDAYEAVRFLLQGSTRLASVRQSRLVAFLRSLPMVPARILHGFAGHVGATTGSTLSPTLAQLQAHRASPLGAFFVARREPAATDELIRRDLQPMLQRGLPARAIPGAVSTKDATWGDALDPASIKLEPAVTIAAQTKARTAWPEVYPGSIVTRDQWIELQSQLCWKSCGFSVNQDAQGRTIFVSATIAGGASVTDATIEWGNRLVQAWGVVGAVGTVDDPTTLTRVEHTWLPPSKMGPPGAGYTPLLFDTEFPTAVHSGIAFSVNGSGDLVIANQTGGSLDVRLMVRSSPIYTPGSTTDTPPWLDRDQMQHDDLAELYKSTTISARGTSQQFAGVDAGALRRVVYSGPLLREAGQGIPQGVVLDTSEDWRNRWVLVVPLQRYTGTTPSPDNVYPVIGAWGMLPSASQRPSAPRLFFTGAGQAMGSPTVLANQHLCSNITGGTNENAWLFARDTDGALVMEMKDGLSDNRCFAGLLMLIATEQTTGDSVVTPVPVHATQVQTLDLEQPLNCGVYAQGRQGGAPRYLLTDPEPKVRPTCPALGIVSDGNSPVRPAKWEIRERLGALDDGTWERRQPIEKQRKRIVSMSVGAGVTKPIDYFNLPASMQPGNEDQVDFRDRLLWVEGRYASNDITIGNASQQSDISGNAIVVLMYTGPGVDIETQIGTNLFIKFEFTRNYANGGYHSRLLVRNATGAAVYVNLTVEMSGFLGCTDRRAIGW